MSYNTQGLNLDRVKIYAGPAGDAVVDLAEDWIALGQEIIETLAVDCINYTSTLRNGCKADPASIVFI